MMLYLRLFFEFFKTGLFAVGGGGDKVKRLVADFRIPGDAPINKRLHLRIHRIEIYRRRHDDHVSGDHLFQNLSLIHI